MEIFVWNYGTVALFSSVLFYLLMSVWMWYCKVLLSFFSGLFSFHMFFGNTLLYNVVPFCNIPVCAISKLFISYNLFLHAYVEANWSCSKCHVYPKYIAEYHVPYGTCSGVSNSLSYFFQIAFVFIFFKKKKKKKNIILFYVPYLRSNERVNLDKGNHIYYLHLTIFTYVPMIIVALFGQLT